MVYTAIEWFISRYPACSISADGAWVVLEGSPERVLPKDVLGPADVIGPMPTRLTESVGDAFDHFLLLGTLKTGCAEHLRTHVARYGLSPLCLEHGLPPLHRNQSTGSKSTRTKCAREAPDSDWRPGAVRVDAAVEIARFLGAVLHLADAVRRGRPIARWNIEDVGVPGKAKLSGLQQSSLAEWTRTGTLSASNGRLLVVQAAEEFLEQCGTHPGVSWVGRKRPELVMKAEDVWGIFALEMTRRLSLDGDRRTVHQCVRCRTPVVLARSPREGDQTYCFAADCRREKERLRKAAQRAKRSVGS